MATSLGMWESPTDTPLKLPDSGFRFGFLVACILHSLACLVPLLALSVCLLACVGSQQSHTVATSLGSLYSDFRFGFLAACILHFFVCLLSLLALSVFLLVFASLPPFRLLGFCSFARLIPFLPSLLFALLLLCIFRCF